MTTLGDGTPVILDEDRVWFGDPTLEPTRLDARVGYVWGSSRERWWAHLGYSYDDDATVQFYSSIPADPSVPRGRWLSAGCFHNACVFFGEQGRALSARDGLFEQVASLPFDLRAPFITEAGSALRLVALGAVADLDNGNWVLRSSPEIGRSIRVFGSTPTHVYAGSQDDGRALVLEGTVQSDVPNATTISWRSVGTLPDALSGVRALWARAEDDIWVGGNTLAHWDGEMWSEIPLPGPVSAIGGNNEERVWVLADGSLFSIDQAGELPRRAVHAPHATRIAVHDGHVFLLDGNGALSQLREDRTEPLAHLTERFWDLVELRSGEVAAVGARGIEVFDGHSWRSVPLESHIPIAVLRGSALNDLYVTSVRRVPGEDGDAPRSSGLIQVVRFDGATAREVARCAGASQGVVTTDAWVAYCDGGSEVAIGTARGVHRMAANVQYANVFIDAGRGHAFAPHDGLFWFDGREWTRVSGSTVPLVGRTGFTGDERGRLAFLGASRVTVVDEGRTHHFFDDEINLWAAGSVHGPTFAEDGSIIVRNRQRLWSSDGSSWSAPSDHMADVLWARNSADVWARGAEGLLHWNGQEWERELSPFPMMAASGTESAVYIGSASGFFLRLESGTWTYTHLPTDHAIRWVDAHHDNDLYALDDTGTLFHFDGREWRSRSTRDSSDAASRRNFWRQGADLLRSGGASIERCRGCLSSEPHWVAARAHPVSFGEAESVLPPEAWLRLGFDQPSVRTESAPASDPSSCASSVEAFERGESDFPQGECGAFFNFSQVMIAPGGRVAWSEPSGSYAEAFIVREGDRVVDRQELSVATLSPRLAWFEARHREGFRIAERISAHVSVQGPIGASTGMLRGRFAGWMLVMESDARGYQLRLVAPDNRHAFTVLSRRKSSFWCGARPSSACVAEVSVPEVFAGDDRLVFVVATAGGEVRERHDGATSRRTYVHVPLSDEMRALMAVPSAPSGP